MTDGLPTRRAIVAGGLMAVGSAAAYLAVPRPAGGVQPPDLAGNVPLRFAGWSADTSVTPLLPDDALQATINQIYDETLARTYRDADGGAVMLVIAYGSRQTESLQAHQPEVCYAAQGFQVARRGSAALPGRYAPITAERLYATQGPRTEPILYWLSSSGEVTNFGSALRWRQIQLGLKGVVPEGFLVRASLIGPDEGKSYETLARFLSAMLDSLPAETRRRVAGI